MAETKVIAVVGVGPGLGASLARRFGREGFAVGLIARHVDSLDPVQTDLARRNVPRCSIVADATQPAQVQMAFAQIREELGPPGVLVYNAGSFVRAGILEIAPKQFVESWETNCLGALLAAQEVLPDMLSAGGGTILLTGATGSIRGGDKFACLAVGKFGLRALGQSMAREFGARGIHVAHVIVDGQIDYTTPLARTARDRAADAYLAADAIAEVYWQLHMQHRTTWTHELDLRPHGERF